MIRQLLMAQYRVECESKMTMKDIIERLSKITEIPAYNLNIIDLKYDGKMYIKLCSSAGFKHKLKNSFMPMINIELQSTNEKTKILMLFTLKDYILKALNEYLAVVSFGFLILLVNFVYCFFSNGHVSVEILLPISFMMFRFWGVPHILRKTSKEVFEILYPLVSCIDKDTSISL